MSKRKRNDLSLADKYEVVKLLDQKLPQTEISKKLGCSQSQISRISSKREEIRNQYHSNSNPERKRQRTGKSVVLIFIILQILLLTCYFVKMSVLVLIDEIKCDILTYFFHFKPSNQLQDQQLSRFPYVAFYHISTLYLYKPYQDPQNVKVRCLFTYNRMSFTK